MFIDNNEDDISEHENKTELLKKVRSYYKGIAIDRDESEYEIDGKIITLDRDGEIIASEPYYEVGCVPSGRIGSPFQQSEFI
jgi:hypothetical protein